MAKVNNAKEFKCPNCGGPLAFDPSYGMLVCAACGSQFGPDELSMDARKLKDIKTFQWGKYKESLNHDHLDNTAVYTCESCGATIEADATTAATKCPYCDNNVVLTDRVSSGLRPNAIIPFKITPKELPAAVRRFYKGKRLLPGNFFSDSALSGVQGVYVPFWLFDCHISGGMNLQGTVIREYTEGDYECTETSYFLLERDGDMAFSHIPVDGSKKMPDDLMDSIEPFDFSELVDFEDGYLSGYLADRFDNDPDQSLPRANKRVLNSAEEVIKGTCRGYHAVTLRSNGMQIDDASVKYVLLPVYLLHCQYGGRKYRYAVNGQTGKVVGELPISGAKSLAYFLGTFAAVAGVVSAALLTLFL